MFAALLVQPASWAPSSLAHSPSSSVVRRARPCVAALEWEECNGCQLLRPQQGRPRAMVHFLGGVLVSPAPQVAYRYMLEQMAERGYLVVATPYAVDFDYRKQAAEIRDKFEGARSTLADEYGGLSLFYDQQTCAAGDEGGWVIDFPYFDHPTADKCSSRAAELATPFFMHPRGIVCRGQLSGT